MKEIDINIVDYQGKKPIDYARDNTTKKLFSQLIK